MLRRSRQFPGHATQEESHVSRVALVAAGAGRGNRTPTGLLSPADFKSAASANFAIPASLYKLLIASAL
jgi:hypothetical protein